MKRNTFNWLFGCLLALASGTSTAQLSCFDDNDGDGFYAQYCGGDDCNDSDPAIGGSDQDGDGLLNQACGGNDCNDLDPDAGLADEDGDGFAAIACGGADCADFDPNRFPGNTEVCDVADRDEDCDLSTFGVRDADGDGFVDAACANRNAAGDIVSQGNDCDDSRRTVHPLAPEVCDGRDQDCTGVADDGAQVPLYADMDLDGYGDVTSPVIMECAGTAMLSPVANDCDDGNPAIQPGDQVCVMGAPEALLTCSSDGQWLASTCPSGTLCFAQNNGTGLCLETKDAGTGKKPKNG